MKLALLGPPAAGKGTQARVLERVLRIPQISTGEILREAAKSGTPMGITAGALIDHGEFVPDEMIMEILSERLTHDDCKKGFILDGVPRTLSQAETLERLGLKIDYVFSIEAPDEVILKRVADRRLCSNCSEAYHLISKPPKEENTCDICGSKLISRADDNIETTRHRLDTYHGLTEPLKDFYEQRGKLWHINGNCRIENTTNEILEILGIDKNDKSKNRK